MGTENGHNVPFVESVSLKKRKKKEMKRIKQIAKTFKKGNSNDASINHRLFFHLYPFVHYFLQDIVL